VAADEYYRDNLRALVTRIASPRAVVVLFHGGGWVAGDPHQFDFQRQALARADIASASIEYRVRQRDGTMMDAAVADAIDAGAYVAREFSGVPIFCCGASSGGLLAIHCAVQWPTTGVILFNPVLDLSAERGFKSKAVPPGGNVGLSPLHMTLSSFPSTLIMHGTNDAVVPIAVSREFADKLHNIGSRATVLSYNAAPHGFFNLEPARTETCCEIEAFIFQEIGREIGE
jgi:acetyl esterase